MAQRSIADPIECPLYAGERIEPQEGLTPWRRNVVSGLWEFLVDRTGSVPAVNCYGRIESNAADAVVLVLVPVGTSSRPSMMSVVGELKAPSRSYFLATHELSIRQMRTLTGLETPAVDHDGANPYVYVSRQEADGMLRWRGLRLPTESEWQFAATAYEGMSWWTKIATEDQCRYVRGNTADRAIRDHYSVSVDFDQEAYDGDWLVAPCGRFGPSAAGFYDLAGNVEEWVTTATSTEHSSASDAEGTGITKGGSFLSLIDLCRPESRAMHNALERAGTIGLRAARSLR